jgi:hypothetical protein
MLSRLKRIAIESKTGWLYRYLGINLVLFLWGGKIYSALRKTIIHQFSDWKLIK